MRRACVLLLLIAVVVVVGPFVGGALLGWGPDPRVLPAEGRPVEIGGGRHLNVYEHGEGTPIVLVHGFGSCAGDWVDVPQRLARLGHRVIVYDRAGYGYSTRIESGADDFTYASNARDLVALLDALAIPRATLVGWSFGGGVVQTVAVEMPERVSALALVASTGPDIVSADEREGLGSAELILGSPLGAWILDWVSHVAPLAWQLTHESVSQAFSGEDAVPSGWTIRTQAMLALPGTSRTLTRESARSRPDTLSPERIQAPTLIIQGSDDLLVPYSVAEGLHRRLPRSALVGVVGGSHMLPATHPDLIATRVHELAGSEYAAGRLPGESP